MKGYYYAGLLVLLFISQQAAAQKNRVVIDKIVIGEQQSFDSFQGGTKITGAIIKKNGVEIDITKQSAGKKIDVSGVYRQIDGRKVGVKLPPNTGGEQREGFATFKFAAFPEYNGEEMIFLVELKKAGAFSIALQVSKEAEEAGAGTKEPSPKEEPAKLPDCKIAQLKKISYTFIHDSLFAKLTKDPCGGKLCIDCEPKNNIIQYDFKTNTTIKKFPRSFKGRESSDTKSRYPNVGNGVEFIIRNVNPYLYDVTISDTTLNYNTDASNTYLGLLLGPGLSESEDKAGAQKFNPDTCRLNDTDRLRKAVEDLYDQLGRFYEELLLAPPYTDASCFQEVIGQVRRSINKVLTDSFRTSLLINNYNTLLGFMRTQEEIFTEKIIDELDSAYKKVETRHFIYAYKVPEVDNVDEIQFRFNITPKNKDMALPVVSKGVVRGYTKGGFKIDVSSGLYYGLFNNDNAGLRKDSITNSSGGFDKKMRIYKEESGKGEFGFASFLHFYPRTGGFLNVSATIGAGLNLSDNPKPRYFGGFSLMGGRGTSRIVLNVGIIMGNTTRISNQYPKDANGNYLLLPEDEKELVTKQKFNSNVFVSLSYNLPFLLKKTKMPQVINAPVAPATKDTTGKAKTDTTQKEEANETKTQSAAANAQSFRGNSQQPVIIQSGNSNAMIKEKSKRKFARRRK